MEILVKWGFVFGLIVIFYLLFVVFNKKKRKNIFNTSGAMLMKVKFKVTFQKTSEKSFSLVVGITNGIICATTYVIMGFVENIYLSFLVAIPVLIILILACYSLLGLVYKKKEVDKNV